MGALPVTLAERARVEHARARITSCAEELSASKRDELTADTDVCVTGECVVISDLQRDCPSRMPSS